MEYLTFFKICEGYYYLLPTETIGLDEYKDVSNKERLFPKSIFSKYSNNQQILATELDQTLQRSVHLKSDNYLFVKSSKGDDFFLFSGLSKDILRPRFLLRALPKIQIANEAIKAGELSINNFRLKKRKELLDRLLSKKTTMGDCIQAFSDYAFCDRFVLWEYNPHTNVFLCMSKSHPLSNQIVRIEDKNSLHDFVNSKMSYECRSPITGYDYYEFASQMRTLNRLRLILAGENEVGVLDFLSHYPEFTISDEVQCYIKSFLETKILERRQYLQVAENKVLQYFSMYIPGNLDTFLNGLTSKICEELGYEACSIFLLDSSDKYLLLKATCNKEHIRNPLKEVRYNLKDPSITSRVFNDDMPYSSYDLEHDVYNSHTYEEKIEHTRSNMIAIPLKSENRKWGILRVINKIEKSEGAITHLSSADFLSLKVICTNLSNTLNAEEIHRQYSMRVMELQSRRRELDTELKTLKNFYKVFLHEIRSPISVLNTSALHILELLKKLPTEEQAKLPLERKVHDIYVIGDRLSFIAATYYFHELIKPRTLEFLYAMRDIIMPILNVSIEYIRMQYGIDIIREDTSLIDRKIYGDKTLLALAFNVLISNAAKYTPNTHMAIRISGQLNEDGQYFNLIVSNYGLQIHEDEKEIIFMDGKRGREAIKWKSQGTGIGLHLARSIMRSLRGDLIIKSTFNPVTFSMKIPTFKWEDSKGDQNV